jgi:hypothetical protein
MSESACSHQSASRDCYVNHSRPLPGIKLSVQDRLGNDHLNNPRADLGASVLCGGQRITAARQPAGGAVLDYKVADQITVTIPSYSGQE